MQLNPGQAGLVRELATSGARVQLALAPAGTGKTAAMRVLARAWTDSGGTVIGLAPSAAAAAVLRAEIGTSPANTTDTLAKLIWHLNQDSNHSTNSTDRADRADIRAPDWVGRIGPDTLVVIDEAAMAGTTDLADAIGYVVQRGGSVRLIGGDRQLAAIGAGGVLRDIDAVHGAVTLSQVMRFTDRQTGAPNHAEGAASLALRDGDPAAIAQYTDHGRVHVGDLATVTDSAYTAWTTDRAAGRDAIMLAPTRDLVAQLNAHARTDRLAAAPSPDGPVGPGPSGREVTLADQTRASGGDTVITRRNIAIGATDWVKNGDRWTVQAVLESGALDVVHLRTGRRVTLPAGYVAEHVALGYAATVHGAQGITADTCHTVATGEESRQLLYVAMTRGRHANHVHLATAADGDPHSVITRDAVLPPSAVHLLTQVLARDGAPVSASSQTRDLTDPATRLPAAADRYHDALTAAVEDHLGADGLARIEHTATAIVPGVAGEATWPALRAHLALIGADGAHIAAALGAALAQGDLTGARDIPRWRGR